MEKNEISEEVTVTPVVRDLERLFNRIIKSIWALFERLISGVENLITFVFHYFWMLAIVVIMGGVLGFFSTKIIPRKYESSMVLKLNVDSKDQLINDVNYFNALIDKNENETLAKLLEISTHEASTLSSCEVQSYESFVNKTEALNALFRNTDTAVYYKLNINELMDPLNPELSSTFKITFTATDQGIFQKIEQAFLTFLERVPELQELLASSQKNLAFQQLVYENEMANLDTLSAVLNQATMDRAKNAGNTGGNTYLSMGNGNETTRTTDPLDIRDRYIFYSQKLTRLNLEIKQHETCYFVTSHLNYFGKKIGYGAMSRAIFTAMFAFLITLLFLFFLKLGKKAV